MTLEQEIKLAVKHAAEKAAKEATEKTAKESAKKLKESGVALEIISKCTGLSLAEVEALQFLRKS